MQKRRRGVLHTHEQPCGTLLLTTVGHDWTEVSVSGVNRGDWQPYFEPPYILIWLELAVDDNNKVVELH
jgi:hypothetical protein